MMNDDDDVDDEVQDIAAAFIVVTALVSAIILMIRIFFGSIWVLRAVAIMICIVIIGVVGWAFWRVFFRERS